MNAEKTMAISTEARELLALVAGLLLAIVQLGL